MNTAARAPIMSNVTFTDAQIIFKNFAGIERLPYNPAGKRHFSILLNDAIAQELYAAGWNVKWPSPRENGEIPPPFLSVELNFNVP